MSTTILFTLSTIGDIENGRCFAVDRKQPERLADYVRRVRSEKNFSLLDVQRNSHNQIAGSYVSKIENGLADADGVTPKKLQALALGLQVSEEGIFAVARGKPLEPIAPTDFSSALKAMGVDNFEAYGGVESLTEEDRVEIVAMLATMIEQRLIRRRNAPVKGTSKLARVASPLHPPRWETQPGSGREGEKPVFSARKRDKKSQPTKKSRQA
jgi:transcriptional regulator with XRE-family HTH domain